MTKLIIQIPCYNEEPTLGITLSKLPRQVPGIDKVEWLVIDDGSTDGTVEAAKKGGVDYLISLPRHQGLARAFVAGLNACCAAGADVIVNTDADNQYAADDIPKLVAPILSGEAELVIGVRSIDQIAHFSPIKKFLEKLGSKTVQIFSKTDIPDTASGFRAMSRSAAQKLHVFSEYTYTLETIIEAGQKNMAISYVPIKTNIDLRPSRLFKNYLRYIRHSAVTIIRSFMTYRPFPFFLVPAVLALGIGLLIDMRFLFFYFQGEGDGHIQSLILGAVLKGLGFLLMVVALLADLISVNRKLLEKIDWRLNELHDRLGRKNPSE